MFIQMDVSEVLCSLVTWVVTITAAIYIIYRYATASFNYFSDQGIPGPTPIPIFGNMWGVWKENLPEYDLGLVKKYGKIFGYFDGSVPNFWITDVDMIKAIYVKDFDHFVDHRTIRMEVKYMRKWMIFLKGQAWKDVRSSVTSAFTPGKIKRMSGLIKHCVGDLCDRMTLATQTAQKIDAKTVFASFTMDVITRCAFGLKIDSLGSEDDTLVQKVRTIVNPPTTTSLVGLLPFMFPYLLDVIGRLGEWLYVIEELKFVFNLLENALLERSQSKEKYNDFIEIANESISEFTKEIDGKTLPMWTREEIDEMLVAQSSLFMLAAFDTTSTTLTNTFFLLAKHPNIQEKLYKTVIAKMEEYGEVCHEMVHDMPYLEMVILEVLRFNPPLLRVERQCTKDYSYDNGRIKIKKGQLVTVPVHGLHHLEEYYPDPEKFDPERWSPENKAKRNPYTFAAFGVGPRNCIGMRFAMEEVKLAVSTIIQKFHFFPVEETPDKVRFVDGYSLLIQPLHAPQWGLDIDNPSSANKY